MSAATLAAAPAPAAARGGSVSSSKKGSSSISFTAASDACQSLMQRLHSSQGKADPVFSGDAFSMGAAAQRARRWLPGSTARHAGPPPPDHPPEHHVLAIRTLCPCRWPLCRAAVCAAGSVDVHAGGLKKHIRCAPLTSAWC